MIIFIELPEVRGLQVVEVWAKMGDEKVRAATAPTTDLRTEECIANMTINNKDKVVKKV